MTSVLHYIGLFGVISVACMACMMVVFAIPGHVPETKTAQMTYAAIKTVIYMTPIWGIICIIMYFNPSWVGWSRYVWIPMPLLMVVLLFVAFTVIEKIAE